MPSDSLFRRDLFKIFCMIAVAACVVFLASLNQALLVSTLISLVNVSLLTPVVAAMERRGLARGLAISTLFLATFALVSIASWVGIQSLFSDFDSFKRTAPEYFAKTLERIQGYELGLKSKATFLADLKITETLKAWGASTGQWFLKVAPALAGDLFTGLFIVPILTFFMLKDGGSVRKAFFGLVPNRFFETTFMLQARITTGLSDYIRAKLIEAVVVGLMCFIPFLVLGVPYATVLGIIAGVTNILPYVGPLIGAVPGILIATADPSQSHLLIPILLIYLVANVIDTVLIFPVLVAKLVDMHPLVLIIAVIAGQQYGGLIGMLISTPVASAIKVLAQEIHWLVYEQSRMRSQTTNQNSYNLN